MRLRMYGVSVALAKGLGVEDLWGQLEMVDGHDIDYRGRVHTMSVDSVGDFQVALFLTVRDHRKFMTMKREKKKILVTPQEIAAGTQAVDYNLLAINKVSRRGLYSHYKGSLSVRPLEGLLATQHSLLVKEMRTEWADNAALAEELEAATDKIKKASRKEFTGDFLLLETVNPQRLEEFMDELSQLKKFDFDLDGIDDEQKAFRAFKSGVECTRYSWNFKSTINTKSMAKKIVKFVEQVNPLRGKVHGRKGETPVWFDLFDPIATVYADYDFDTVAAPIDSDTFDKNVLLIEMIDLMKTMPQVFCQAP